MIVQGTPAIVIWESLGPTPRSTPVIVTLVPPSAGPDSGDTFNKKAHTSLIIEQKTELRHFRQQIERRTISHYYSVLLQIVWMFAVTAAQDRVRIHADDYKLKHTSLKEHSKV